VPLSDPDVGETASQPASVVAFQAVFAVTARVNESPLYPTDRESGFMFNLAGPASCATVMMLVIPLPATMTVPVRAFMVMFSVREMLKEALFSPAVRETVIQSMFLLTFHATFAMTETEVEPKPYPPKNKFVLTETIGGDGICVTGMLRVIPPPETVIDPVRGSMVGFVAYEMVNEPSLVPEDGEKPIHDPTRLTLHATFALTSTVNEPAVFPKFNSFTSTESAGGRHPCAAGVLGSLFWEPSNALTQ